MIDPALDGARLKEALDSIWQCHADCAALAVRLLSELDRTGWIILAAWSIAATFGPVFGCLQIGSQGEFVVSDAWRSDILSARVVQSLDIENTPTLIRFYGTQYGVVVNEDSPFLPHGRVVYRPVNYLIALELIRDHIDSTLLLPRELRDQEIGRMAATAEMDDVLFRRLATWYQQIESQVSSAYL